MTWKSQLWCLEPESRWRACRQSSPSTPPLMITLPPTHTAHSASAWVAIDVPVIKWMPMKAHTCTGLDGGGTSSPQHILARCHCTEMREVYAAWLVASVIDVQTG